MSDMRSFMTGVKKHLGVLIGPILQQRWTNVGLRSKMGLIVEVGLIGLISIFVFLGVSTASKATREILSERMMLARLSAASLDANIRQIQAIMTLLSENEVLQDPQSDHQERQKALMEGYRLLSQTSGELIYYNPSRNLIEAANGSVSEDPAALYQTFKDLNETDEPRLVTLPGDSSRSAVVVLVRDLNGSLSGLLVAELVLEKDAFSTFREIINLGETGRLDVVNSSGRVLISSQAIQDKPQDYESQLWDRFFVSGKPGVETCLGCSRGDSSESTDEVIAFAPLKMAPWGVVIRQKSSELMKPVNRLLIQTLLLGAVSIIGALFLVWVTTNSVIEPVQKLREAAERIAQGDLDTPIQIPVQNWIYGRDRRRDEIGDLALSFSTMRRKLKHSIGEINQLNRELDAHVQERTQAALSAQLEAQAARDDLRAIIDALSDELIVVNADDRSVLLANQAVLEHHPEVGEPVNQPCIQICHRGEPCEGVECECPLPLVLMTGKPVRVTHEVIGADGSTKKYTEISASPMKDSQGNINRIVELARDVTATKKLEASLVRRNQQLSILNAIAVTVNQSLNLQEILTRTLEAVVKLTEIDMGAVFLQEELQGMLRLMAYHGISEQAARYASDMGMLDGACGGITDHRQIVIVSDLSRYHTRRARNLQKENMSTLVHVPLVVKDSFLGSMCVGTRSKKEFSKEDEALLAAIGSQIAVAIENAKLYEEVQQKERMRGELFLKAINAQEEERKRIARELHDDTSQAMAALLFAIEESLEMEETDAIHERLEGMHDLVQHTLDGVHKLIFDLRPSMLDHLGLVPAIRWFAKSRLESKGVRVFIEDEMTDSRLSPEVETALFRIVQEGVLNTARHAAARNLWVRFRKVDGRVEVDVEDDGLGFDLKNLSSPIESMRGMGLMGVQERLELIGGELEIWTAPGSGTHLKIHVPVSIGEAVYA